MDNEPMSSQVAEGQEETSSSPQAAETGAQAPSQAQEATRTQVEGTNQSTSQEDTRKASDFETARQFKRLAREIQSLKQALEKGTQSQASSSSPAAAPKPFSITNEELSKDPVAAIQRMLEAHSQTLLGQIPQAVQQKEQELGYQRSRQEALKMIRTNDTVKKDPEGMDRMADILTDEEYNLDEISKTHPLHAAKLALEIYNARYAGGKKVQGAPSKAQMVSTATAVNSGGGKVNLVNEAAQLQKEVLNNPALLNDPAFKARMSAMVNKAKQESMAGV